MLVADTVFAPVIAIFGTGESCTASLKVAVMVTEVPDLYGPDVEYVIAAVGAVTSTVTEIVSVAVFPAASVAVAVRV
jgi:hypothetical protein